MQILIRYGFFIPLEADLTLSDFLFALLMIATVSIAAAGNIINDIYDVEIDYINKPEKVIIGKKITEKNANYLFIILNVIGVGLGFYISNQIGKPEFSGYFVVISALLYLYATFIKSIPIFGNVIVSALVAFSLLIVGLFDLLPTINFLNQDYQSFIFGILLNYSFFAFYINLMREIVKDIEDIDGDKNCDLSTLPIILGRRRTSYIVFGMSIFVMFGTVYYIYIHLYNYTSAVVYFLLFTLAPLLYFSIKIWNAKNKSDYAFLSKLLKVIMLLGMCSILLYTFVII
ncbi:MAG: 4-hydroxybenzoate polyprenyltransferase [bacterium]|jgi:4-hydroxybenzoate polyprenyltransferase